MHAAAPPAAKPAAAAGGAAAKVDPVVSLAQNIFAHLAGPAAVDTAPASRAPENAEALARTSFVFAEAFLRVEAERNASAAPPPVAFDINTLDFDGWSGTTKPAA